MPPTAQQQQIQDNFFFIISSQGLNDTSKYWNTCDGVIYCNYSQRNSICFVKAPTLHTRLKQTKNLTTQRSHTHCNHTVLCVWCLSFRVEVWCCRSPHPVRRGLDVCGSGQLETPQHTAALQGPCSNQSNMFYSQNLKKWSDNTDCVLCFFVRSRMVQRSLWSPATANTFTMTTMTTWQERVSEHVVVVTNRFLLVVIKLSVVIRPLCSIICKANQGSSNDSACH